MKQTSDKQTESATLKTVENQRSSKQNISIKDNRTESIQLKEAKEMMQNSKGMIAQRQQFDLALGRGTADTRSNETGMPDHLKTGLENLSGFDLSDVKVHYNSSKPAQLQALAYAQGNEIHLGPGQEKHLPHEGWHVVQQRQRRVKPTMQMKGVAVNDDSGLEKEADVMGAKALQMKANNSHIAHQYPHDTIAYQAVAQRAVILLDENKDDYALIKALIGSGDTHNAAQVPSSLTNANAIGGPAEYIIPYSLLSKSGWRGNAERIKDNYVNPGDPSLFNINENIYVVGHGQPGVVWTQPDHNGEINKFNDVVSWMKEIVPEGWSGKIKIMTCNSAVSGKNKKISVAEKISGVWNDDHDDDGRVEVSGQSGFAYGMGDGTMAVLKSDFEDMYKASSDRDLNKEMIAHLGKKALDLGVKKVEELINFTITKENKKELKFNSYVASSFVGKKLAIEARLKEIVEGDISGDIYAKKIAMEADNEFMELIAKQKALFSAFDLWEENGEVTFK